MAEGKLGLPTWPCPGAPPRPLQTALLNGKKIGEFWGYDTKCIVGPRRRAVQQQQPSDLQVRKGREDLQEAKLFVAHCVELGTHERISAQRGS